MPINANNTSQVLGLAHSFSTVSIIFCYVSKQHNRNKYNPALFFFFIIASTALFLGYYRNQWNSARDVKFSNVDKFSESLVIGRLVQSRQDGIFSKAALLGMGDTDPSNMKEIDSDRQYDTYFNGGSFSTYFIYRSHNAFQAVMFSLIDSISPFSPNRNLRLFRDITSLLTAVAIGLLLTWIYHEFGLFTALITFFTTVMSQWITVFGRNIFWGIWVYFLPLLAVIIALEVEKQKKEINNRRFVGVVFAAILIKCLLSGYDFIPTAAISTCIPIVYYSVYERWDMLRLLRKFGLAAMGASAAIFLSLAILAAQIGYIEGNYKAGIQHIENSISRRTYGDANQYPQYSESLQAKSTDVLLTYLTRDEIFRKSPLRFSDITLLYFFFSCVLIVLTLWKKENIDKNNKGYALIAATWLAFIGSISTYIIFKGASYIHTHLYFIVWHLPFTILGFALCGYTLKVIYQTLFPLHKKR